MEKQFIFGSRYKGIRTFLMILFLVAILYALIDTLYIRRYGLYTTAVAEKVLDGPRGVTIYYKYSIDGVEYERNRLTLKLQIPRMNERFLIKYREGYPEAPEFFLGTDIPDCFEFGKSYSDLSCP